MVIIKILNVSLEKENVFNFNDEEMKYEDIKDRKLAFASRILKKNVNMKHYSVTHSYPFCIVAESDNKIGVDVENINRKIEWKTIATKKFDHNVVLTSRLDFLTMWVMKEAYFKYSQDHNYLKISLDDIKKKCFCVWDSLDDMIYGVCMKTKDENISYEPVKLKSFFD